MLNKLKNLEKNFSVSKAAVIIGVFTLLSKLVALVRDPLLAGKIGVGTTLDIYYAAFRVPDFIFNLLILGTLSVALIPVFTEWVVKDKQKAYRVASSVLNISLLGMAVICLILFVFSAPLTKFLVPGFSGEKLARTVELMRLFLLSPIIFTASNIFTSILSSYKKIPGFELGTNYVQSWHNWRLVFSVSSLWPYGLGFCGYCRGFNAYAGTNPGSFAARFPLAGCYGLYRPGP